MENNGKCPMSGGAHGDTAPRAASNQDWWPNQLNLKVLHQNSSLSDPMTKEFSYAEAFKSLDLDALIKDLHALMKRDKRIAERIKDMVEKRTGHRVAAKESTKAEDE